MAIAENDRAMQAKCLCCFADIHRRRNDIQRAFTRYEAAMNIMVEIGDRYGQIDVLAGMSKTMTLMKQLAKVCECKALEYNSKALDLSRSIGNKMHQLRCHLRMQELYRSLGDQENVEDCSKHARRLLVDMDLICGVCGKPTGDKADHLEALQCCHIVHTRCSSQLTRSTAGRRGSRVINCSKCKKTLPRTPSCGTPVTGSSQTPGTPGSASSISSGIINPLPLTASPGNAMGARTPTVSCDPATGGGVVSGVLESSMIHGNPVYL